MDKDKCKDCCEKLHKHHHHGGNASGGAFYGLGFIGALIYYIQGSQTFMDGVIGFLKALVWPTFLIYRVLTLLKI